MFFSCCTVHAFNPIVKQSRESQWAFLKNDPFAEVRKQVLSAGNPIVCGCHTKAGRVPNCHNPINGWVWIKCQWVGTALFSFKDSKPHDFGLSDHSVRRNAHHLYVSTGNHLNGHVSYNVLCIHPSNTTICIVFFALTRTCPHSTKPC